MASFHVEIVQKKQSRASKDIVTGIVQSYVSNLASLTPGATITETDLKENLELNEHVQAITFCNIDHDTEMVATSVNLVYHVFKLDEVGAETDTMTDTSNGEEFAVAEVWALPARDFHGLWESLVYDSKLKEDTVRFVETALYFADCGVNPNIVSWNRVVLLHGPPGTGKTSLCRALAQKLAIRLGQRFPRARLIEVNAHALFSKWFSESGKIVARLFERITEIIEDPRLLACVLIDEVESLAHARRSSLASLEPSDSIRAVNALLTQLDRLCRHPNTLILTTSNVTGAIDLAFVDRADIKRHIGPPTRRAAYEILRSCCEELMAHGLVQPRDQLFPLHLLELTHFAENTPSHNSLRLWKVAGEMAAGGASGRTLRRLPLRAMALHTCHLPSLTQFMTALQCALGSHLKDVANLDESPAPPMPNGHSHLNNITNDQTVVD